MANKAWSILFGVAMLACAVGFGISPWMGWWMPEGVSSHAGDVDFLFNIILYITSFFFLLTEGILVAFMWKYASTGGKPPVSDKAEYPALLKPLTNILHDQHRIEMAWTFIPAVLLLYIAFAQVSTWANIKYESRNKDQAGAATSVQIAVSARQFEWRIRYPSVSRFETWMKDRKDPKGAYDSFGKVPQADDIYTVNELHVWKGHPVLVHLSTRDVIHSFNMPNLRVKQDALPGKLIPVFFKPTRPNTAWSKEKNRYLDGIKVDENNPDNNKADHDYIWDIACAELCGWGHYRMIGRIFVHKDQPEFLDWLKKAEKNHTRRTTDR